ncbi:ChrR family anti-sigma-E factor [Afipia sp. DC4300-2b1]|uniref:ChrR family anti-sigma-E factor n=1 Tax=Afipia sp. DC4300-2b1 TaxID=2804672 RepID=UPI003CF43418
MTIQYHISDDLLLGYSSGNLDEASSLLVATHLALCPHCRTRAGSADSLGGYMLDVVPETAVSPSMLDTLLARVRSDGDLHQPASASRFSSDAVIPEPLRGYVGGDLKDLKWVRLAPRVQQIMIDTPDCPSQARLLRFQSGMSVPEHGHRGRELTLVLTGSLCDRETILRRGDISETDERTEHQPYAGPDEDCVCLAVTDAPLRFKGMLARLLQPLFGI